MFNEQKYFIKNLGTNTFVLKKKRNLHDLIIKSVQSNLLYLFIAIGVIPVSSLYYIARIHRHINDLILYLAKNLLCSDE